MGANLSLVFFTCFAQAAVGMVLLFGLLPRGAEVPSAGGAPGNIVMERLRARGGAALAAALVLFGLGVLFSLLHLSDPFISFYSITNAGASWLSREILFVGLFGFCLLLFFFVRNPLVNLVAALAGLALIFVMSRVYINPPVLFWRTGLTFWVFLSTALLLGAAMLVLIAAVRNRGMSAPTQGLAAGPLPLVLVAAAGARLVFGLLQLLHGLGAPVRPDLLLINLLGVLLALLLLFWGVQKVGRVPPGGAHFAALAFGVALLLWIAELAGRIMFYEALTSFIM